eukprot:219403_1
MAKSIPKQYAADLNTPYTDPNKDGMQHLEMLQWSAAHIHMIQGYKKEKQRILTSQSRCAHIHFHSCQQFCDVIQQSLSSRWNNQMNTIDESNFSKLSKLFNMCSHGICQKCAFLLCPFFYEFLTCKVYPPSKKINILMYDCDIMSLMNMFLSNILQYPNLASFYLKETKMYQQLLIFHSLDIIQKCKVYRSKQVNHFFHDKEVRKKFISNWQQNIFCFGNQICRNLWLFRKRETVNMIQSFANLELLFNAMLEELDMQISANYSGIVFSLDILSNMFTIFSMCIHFGYRIKSCKKNKFVQKIEILKKEFALRQLRIKQKEKQTNNFKLQYRHSVLIKLLEFCMESLKQCNLHYEIRRNYAKCIWNDKYNRMQCQYDKCKKERKQSTLYRCANCVARYCCKNHQKKDWNLSNHKQICLLYSNIKRQQ